MIKKSIIVMITTAILAGCSLPRESPLTPQQLHDAWETPHTAAINLVKQFSPREKIGQLLMLDIRYWRTAPIGQPLPLTDWKIDSQHRLPPVTILPAALAKIVHQYAVGSIILFRENLADTQQIHQLTSQLQAARKGLPLFIGIDQEGGVVQRLPTGTQLPGNMALGATREPGLAYRAGLITGHELQALGFNINFAPVVDVNSNQNNPVIGVRAYGSQSELVTQLSQAYIEGLQQTGVLATAKHFPGHGNTSKDSHTSLPTVPYKLTNWQAIDLPPFKQAMQREVDAIMTAHVTVPALEDTRVTSMKDGTTIGLPATLSKKIINGLLRTEWHYQGLIFSDSLYMMEAIAENFERQQAVKKMLLAGIDIAVMPLPLWNPSDEKTLATLYRYLEKEMQLDPEFARCVDSAVQRVVLTKLKKKISPVSLPLTTALAVVGSQPHQQFARTVANQAVTLIKNEGVLPLMSSGRPRLLLLSDSQNNNRVVQDELHKINAVIAPDRILLQDRVVTLAGERLPPEIPSLIAQCDTVILMTYDLKIDPKAAQQIIDRAHQYKKPLVVISAKNPYDIAYLQGVTANLAVYGITGFDQTNFMRNTLETNIRAGIRTLFKNQRHLPGIFNQPSGKLPVDIKNPAGDRILYPYGYGLTY